MTLSTSLSKERSDLELAYSSNGCRNPKRLLDTQDQPRQAEAFYQPVSNVGLGL
jgi:hypothetical protein